MTQNTLTHTQTTSPITLHYTITALALLITAGTTAHYFATMWPMRPIALTTRAIPAGYDDLLLTVLPLFIGIQLLLPLLFKLTNSPAISSSARRNANFVMTLGVLAAVGSIFFPELTSFCTANMALVGFVIAQNVKLITHLFTSKPSSI